MKYLAFLSSMSIAAGLAFGLADTASATTFEFDWSRDDANNVFTQPNANNSNWNRVNLGQSAVTGQDQRISISDGAGVYESLSTTYNDETEEFTFSASFTDGQSAINGGWLVVSPGANPAGSVEEFAIFYLDVPNNKVTAYSYDGTYKKDAYLYTELLDTFEDAFDYSSEGGETSLSFSIDATKINAANITNSNGTSWKGVGFAETVGVWFHAGAYTNVTYNEEGGIENFHTGAHWFDSITHLDTQIVEVTSGDEVVPESVPEPAGLLGLGLVGGMSALAQRRKKGEGADQPALA